MLKDAMIQLLEKSPASTGMNVPQAPLEHIGFVTSEQQREFLVQHRPGSWTLQAAGHWSYEAGDAVLPQ
jgi:hypothetical protein